MRIRWAVDEASQRFQFEWREIDGPAVARPQRKGFGLVILNTVVPAAFGGTAALRTSTKGVSWHLEAPLTAVTNSVEEMPGGRSPLRPSKSTQEKAQSSVRSCNRR